MSGVNQFPYLPQEDAISKPFWDATREKKLLIQFCPQCLTHQWYPRVICINCGCVEITWIQVAGTGTVDSWTEVFRPPSEGFVPPYVIARVLLTEKVLMLTRLIGESPECDKPVTLKWQEISDGRALPVFS